MRSGIRIPAIALGAALVLALGAGVVRADRPTLPAWFNGEEVRVMPVPEAQPAIPPQVANPLYVFGGAQNHVLGSGIPGVAGYNPWWSVVVVTVLDDRNLSTDPFTSEEEILEAWARGDEVALTDTGFILLCQVVAK